MFIIPSRKHEAMNELVTSLSNERGDPSLGDPGAQVKPSHSWSQNEPRKSTRRPAKSLDHQDSVILLVPDGWHGRA